jgi:hypothetical protein
VVATDGKKRDDWVVLHPLLEIEEVASDGAPTVACLRRLLEERPAVFPPLLPSPTW